MSSEQKQNDCPDLFLNQRVLVLGLGKTGLSCVRFLQQLGVDVGVMDSRSVPPCIDSLQAEFPGVPVYLGKFDGAVMQQYDVLCVSPGISIREATIRAALANGVDITGDIDIFARCNSKPVVAITGSNGKSTVTALVGEMAAQAKINVAVAGNIGVPVLDLLRQQQTVDLYVLELSSFQLETTSYLNAAVSTILNISEDHMDRYDSIQDYAEAKRRIYNGDGYVVINKDENDTQSQLSRRKLLHFGLTEPACENDYGVIEHDNQRWLAKGQQRLMPESLLKIKGQHNVANALASLALGECAGIPMPAMLTALQNFAGLTHRTQLVLEKNGVTWINDSKATNVGATAAAVKGFAGNNIIVLLGGQGKGQDFSPLVDVLPQHCKQALIYGQDADLIYAVLKDKLDVKKVVDLREAIDVAAQSVTTGDLVLLSPACASFDMFNGFEHRGNEFMRMVKEVHA